MNLFQTIDYTFQSELSPEHCLSLIKKNIHLINRFNGKVKGNTFKITREINYSNSFLPVILGEILKTPNSDSMVRLKLRMNSFVRIFFLIWFAIFSLGSIATCLMAVNSGSFFPPIYLFTLIPIGAFLIFNYFFKKEVKLAKEILEQILSVDENSSLE